MTAETDLLPLPGVKCWRAMKDRNGNVGYSDKPDPKYSESAGTDGLTWVRLNDHRAAMQAYARANMEPLIAEIEALRAEVERLNRIIGRIVEGDGGLTVGIRWGTDAFAAAREYLLRDKEEGHEQ